MFAWLFWTTASCRLPMASLAIMDKRSGRRTLLQDDDWQYPSPSGRACCRPVTGRQDDLPTKESAALRGTAACRPLFQHGRFYCPGLLLLCRLLHQYSAASPASADAAGILIHYHLKKIFMPHAIPPKRPSTSASNSVFTSTVPAAPYPVGAHR